MEHSTQCRMVEPAVSMETHHQWGEPGTQLCSGYSAGQAPWRTDSWPVTLVARGEDAALGWPLEVSNILHMIVWAPWLHTSLQGHLRGRSLSRPRDCLCSSGFHLGQSCSAQLLRPVRLFVTPWIVAYQAPMSMGFFRQEYWSGLPFHPPGDLPDPGIKPTSPESAAIGKRILHYWATWGAIWASSDL